MKITFVLAGYEMTGGMRVIAIYADRLRRRGHDVLVVAPPNRAATPRGRLRALRRGHPWPRRRPPSHVDGLGLPCRTLERHRPVEDRDVPDADVVVATWWETAEWVAALGPSKGAKAHFIQNQEGSPLWFPPEFIARAAAIYRLPMTRITISRSLREWLAADYGCLDVALVPNSVDRELFHAPPRGRRPHPTVGLLYHTVPLKGLSCSLAALALARRALPDLRVVSFGHGREAPELPLPPGSTLHVDPPQERIRELYAACDVWLCGSRIEGFHLPPLEAMACRCPVVSTRVGGPDEIVEDGVNGYLVDVGDADALADRLLRVLTLGDDAWRAMSEAAHATARSYTWDDATDRFEAALRAAVERHHAGSLANA